MSDHPGVGRWEVRRLSRSGRIPEGWLPFAVTESNGQVGIWIRHFTYADDEPGTGDV